MEPSWSFVFDSTSCTVSRSFMAVAASTASTPQQTFAWRRRLLVEFASPLSRYRQTSRPFLPLQWPAAHSKTWERRSSMCQEVLWQLDNVSIGATIVWMAYIVSSQRWKSHRLPVAFVSVVMLINAECATCQQSLSVWLTECINLPIGDIHTTWYFMTHASSGTVYGVVRIKSIHWANYLQCDSHYMSKGCPPQVVSSSTMC